MRNCTRPMGISQTAALASMLRQRCAWQGALLCHVMNAKSARLQMCLREEINDRLGYSSTHMVHLS